MDTPLHYPGIDIPYMIEFTGIKTFFHCVYPPGYHFKGESHNFWEFVIILDGKAGICAGENMYYLKKGQCFWHRPDEFHSIWTEGNQPLHLGIFSFSGEVRFPVSGKIFSASQTICRQFIELRKMAEEIFIFTVPHNETLLSPHQLIPGKEAALASFVGRVTSLLAHTVTMEIPNEQKNSPSAENYLRILNVLSQAQAERLTIPEIASRCNMSVSNAKRVFNKYAGCSISDYCNNTKISAAKHLLSSGHSVAETAEMLGFNDPNYFCSFFKRLTGFPPSKYRS